MKKISILILILIFLAGCDITAKVVEDIGSPQTQFEKDQNKLKAALNEKEISNCYYIENQPTREACFILLAQELKDSSICENLLGDSLRESCIVGAS